MLQLAHDAIQRHQTQPAMLYISLDQVATISPKRQYDSSVTMRHESLPTDHNMCRSCLAAVVCLCRASRQPTWFMVRRPYSVLRLSMGDSAVYQEPLLKLLCFV